MPTASSVAGTPKAPTSRRSLAATCTEVEDTINSIHRKLLAGQTAQEAYHAAL